MAHAATAPPDLFARALLASQRLRMGTGGRLRLASIEARLRGEGVAPDDPRIAHWLAAALCATREERLRFIDMLAVQVEGGTAPLAAAPPDPPPAVPPRTNAEAAPAAKVDLRLGIAAGVAVLLFLAAAIYLLWPAPAAQPPANTPGPDLTPIASPVPIPTSPPPPATETQWQAVWLALVALAVPPLAALAYIIWYMRQRRVLHRRPAPQPQHAMTLAFATGPEGLLGGPVARQALRRLRRHRPVRSRALDVPATIRATIAAGGRPELRQGTRPESPAYLLLVERESPRDHVAWAGNVLARRMREERVGVVELEFLGDPRLLRDVSRSASATTETLRDVVAQHDRANALLIADSHDWRADAEADAWVEPLALTLAPALLDPRERSCRGTEPTAGERLGLGTFEFASQGLADYADWLAGVPPARARPNRLEHDLPASLASDRAALLANAPPEPVVLSGLIDDLEEWLGREGFEWLCATALFPYLDPGLTVYLGKSLTDRRAAALLEEARFLRLARLVWMREGFMPDWLRTPLVRRLSPARLENATAAIQTFLTPDSDGATHFDLGLGEGDTDRARLIDWLRRNRSNVLSDRLLVDALSGRAPGELGLEVPPTLNNRLRPLWANRRIRALAAAVLAMAAIVCIAPPFHSVQVPMPKTAPDDPLENLSDNAIDMPPDNTAAPFGNDTDIMGNTVTPVDVPTAAATSVPALKPARVFIHYAAAADIGDAVNLRIALRRDGVVVGNLENRGAASPDTLQVRYKTGQQAVANWLVARVNRMVGQNGRATLRLLTPAEAKRLDDGTLEVWLPRGGLTGTNGGGWGEPTPTPSPTPTGSPSPTAGSWTPERIADNNRKMTAGLRGDAARLANALVTEAASEGIELMILTGYRSLADQQILFASGRTKSGPIVTMAQGLTVHTTGLAFDAVPVVNGSVAFNRADLLKTVGAIGQRLGLVWGGTFKYPDTQHFQTVHAQKVLASQKQATAAESYQPTAAN